MKKVLSVVLTVFVLMQLLTFTSFAQKAAPSELQWMTVTLKL